MRPVHDDLVDAGKPWSGILEPGQHLRITDLEGRQGVDFLCYNADEPLERYHAPNTLKAAGTLRLTTGHRLYSDEARPIMTMVADGVGGFHDTISGCCSAHSNEMLYGVTDCPGCRENFLSVLNDHGLGRRDIVPNINFFCNVPVIDDGKLTERSFVPIPGDDSLAGAYVELRADMRTLAIISNCPQMNNPCNDGQPTPIRVAILAPE